ncbi:hypothetical protein CV014_04770 [Nostoc sp. CMAA1605]|nr:hypothetical protein [Nostoc sp. CMAA1605]
MQITILVIESTVKLPQWKIFYIVNLIKNNKLYISRKLFHLKQYIYMYIFWLEYNIIMWLAG